MDASTRPPGITADEWAATPVVVQHMLLATCTIIAQQQQQHAELLARIADLEARLNQHSQNSSKPPSSDPPSAPPRPERVTRGRKRGGQVGHPRHERAIPTPDQITDTTDHYPTTCQQCGSDVRGNQHDVCLVQTQYVWDLPPVEPQIVAHHYHTIMCRDCGELVTAQRPADVPPGGFGPRLVAMIGMLHGRYRISQREVVQLLADLFQFPISLGSVVTCQATVSVALAPIYDAIQTQVQAAPVVNIDETGWKEAGKRRWLWTVVSSAATLFLVATGRGRTVLQQLIGASYGGIVGSDRGRAYLGQPPERHQLCWAHLIRNFLALTERCGKVALWAADWLALSDIVFRLWHMYQGGGIDRAQVQAAMEPIQASMHALLVTGSRRWDAGEAISQELLEHWDALWTFVREAGVEPTNNAAEQALRPAVLWRKGCFGANSAEGNRFVERILSISATCEQQERHLLTVLTTAVDAYWRGLPAPTLRPAQTEAA
jgi:transposase